MRVRRVGARALLLELGNHEQVEAWRPELWRRRDEFGFTDLVPGAETILMDGVDPAVESRLTPPLPGSASSAAPSIEIPTVFDGADLPDVAELWRVSVPAAVDRLLETALVVAFCGFAPGFAYMCGLPDEWAVPRLPAPRPRVPAGAVALAGAYAGIYPSASPGGWRLVGRTDVTLFDVRAEPPALLSPGTRVRLVPVS
jgi:KipI family sensor histidine kinase inhibitor